MLAYRAEKTLAQCYAAIPHDIVDTVLLVDDGSDDATLAVARELGIVTHRHPRNLGYGANQKTCYRAALADGADIVVMLHPDYQYEPRLITAMAAMIASEVYDVVIGSRILGNTALRGGMPLYKYVANRVLTAAQNLMIGTKLSEFHSGYRAFSSEVLRTIPLLMNSDDFLFDNELLVQDGTPPLPPEQMSAALQLYNAMPAGASNVIARSKPKRLASSLRAATIWASSQRSTSAALTDAWICLKPTAT